MANPSEELRRRFPVRTGLEGAFEDGKELAVIGRKLQTGDLAPNFLLSRIDPQAQIVQTVTITNLPRAFILLPVNSYDTPICQGEARDCERIAAALKGTPSGDIPFIGVSNDSQEFLMDWMRTEGIVNQTILQTSNDSFGTAYGLHILDYNGQLQRAAIAVVDGIVANAEYVYDQGGPLPDFSAALTAARVALAR